MLSSLFKYEHGMLLANASRDAPMTARRLTSAIGGCAAAALDLS